MRKFFLFFITICSCNQLIAQFTSVPTRINTPYGPATIHTQMYTGPMFRYYGSSNPNANVKYEVHLLTDSTISGKGTIEEKKEKFHLKIKSAGEKLILQPGQTKSVTRIMNGNEKIEGVPYKDSCWIFKTIKGKITGYSLSSDPESAYLFAIDVEGKIVPATKDLVLKMVKGNEKAEKQANKGNLTKAVTIFNSKNETDETKLKKDVPADNVYN